MVIDRFKEEYGFLSNFAHCKIMYEGIVYPSVEHAFQGAKCFYIKDKERIAAQPTPAMAKKLGRRVQMKPNWNVERIEVMKVLLRLKFSDETYRKKLLATGDAVLIEGNDWGDKFWGVYRGQGENHLGRLIMEVRNEIKGA